MGRADIIRNKVVELWISDAAWHSAATIAEGLCDAQAMVRAKRGKAAK